MDNVRWWLLTGPVVNGTPLTQGMYYMTNTDPNLTSTSWSTPVLIMGSSSWSSYVEFQFPFVYGNTFYILANTCSAYVGGTYYEYLYSSSAQTFASYTTESTNAISPFPYITGLAGYSLNSGSMVGTSDVSFGDMVLWKGLGAFTLSATPISNPQPILSGVSLSFTGTTLTVTGTVALGSGGTPLWEVGLHNTTQGTYSQATWSSWGVYAPGTVSNTFTGTIAANQGDSITVTAYDVGLESSASTFSAPCDQLHLHHFRHGKRSGSIRRNNHIIRHKFSLNHNSRKRQLFLYGINFRQLLNHSHFKRLYLLACPVSRGNNQY